MVKDIMYNYPGNTDNNRETIIGRVKCIKGTVEAFCDAKETQVISSLKSLHGPVSAAKGKLAEVEKTLNRLRKEIFTISDGARVELGELVREGSEWFPDRISTERPTLLFGAQGTNTDEIPDRGINAWGPYKYLQHLRNSPLLAVVC